MRAGIKIAGKNINNLTYADDTTLMAESKEELHLDEDEKGEWKSWLKSQLTNIMASSLIISWQMDGETIETVRDFTLGAPKSL